MNKLDDLGYAHLDSRIMHDATYDSFQQRIFDQIRVHESLQRRAALRQREADVEALRQAFRCLSYSYQSDYDARERLRNLRRYYLRDVYPEYPHLTGLDARFYTYGLILALIPLGPCKVLLPNSYIHTYRYALELLNTSEPSDAFSLSSPGSRIS